MAMIFNQSEESKAIKRLNERLKEIDKLTEPGQDNPLIARYSRELRESGIDFTKDEGTNRYRIRNTEKNREKIGALEAKLSNKERVKTAGEYKKDVRAQLKKEGKKPTAQAVKARISEIAEGAKIQSMLTVIYTETGNRELGEELSRLTAGRKYTERDSGAIFDLHGRIKEEFKRIQRGELTKEEEERAKEREDVYGDYGYPDDYDNEDDF